ncbi:toll/interleukin-1 receptor domain-containing protein [Chlorobaculum thiosulfatiphilum]|uniref:Toll/interleukin-1 receptor domain-containing protein n=1 Tax=Chlorobaculum thiosulfatiphilum TaxID=115852 RepID=A0A5C4S7A5_CHLTI|nr:toll/interleukin-1 receptor domain-containing protein [Chlorobaculum thiosulfatiphilum]TNJ39185.1 toll/interleukin-1 receptor domain-containing protein [Chlorobaculum thiosulfatiphilum]
MANSKHLAILRQGAEAWNSWREEFLAFEPDLNGANLRGLSLWRANLSEADLSDADLSGADLSEALLSESKLDRAKLEQTNLRRAQLSEANLRDAKLNGAKLEWANLNKADLHGANLEEANLRETKLNGAKLEWANLRRANLSEANLSDAELSWADLREAKLNGAKLERAGLNNANLSGADLSGTNLLFASVFGADFSGIYASATIFAELDLSTVRGLETVQHHSSSAIGIDTLYLSKGKIPEAFLRGCGVPDQMIEYTRSLTATPFQYYSCFISYSHNDEEFAKRLWEGLQANNVRCWLASEDMKIGDKIRPTIDESIRIHDKLLLILSEHSVQSDWVEHEVEHALDRERIEKKNILFPVRLDEAVMDSTTGWAGNVKRQRHIGDFTLWKDHDAYKKSFDRLLRDLKAGK